MAPALVSDVPIHSEPTQKGNNGVHKKAAYPQPLKLSGALNEFTWEDATPVIGREFPTVNIVDDLMNSSNADELLRDLAITSKPNDHCNLNIYDIDDTCSFAARGCLLQIAK